ncbi:MAG: hypothetical protein ACI9MR_002164 [Myxococcota bacterium]|jgi:hypothetical protein
MTPARYFGLVSHPEHAMKLAQWLMLPLAVVALNACDTKQPMVEVVPPGPKVETPTATPSRGDKPVGIKPASLPLVVPESKWTTHASEAGAFNARFPNTVEVSFDQVTTVDGARIDEIHNTAAGKAGYLISWSDYPKGSLTAAGDAAVIADAQAYFAKKFKGSVKFGKQVKDAGHTWTEASVRVPEAAIIITMRHTVIAGRLFQMAVLSEGAPPAADAAMFFGSFNAFPLTIRTQKASRWKPVVFHEGLAQIDAPSNPTITRVPLDDGLGTMIVTSFTHGTGARTVFMQAAYLAEEIDVPNAADREARFDGGRDGLLAALKSTLVSERTLTHQGLIGREIVATATPANAPGTVFLHGRLFFHKKRLYQLQGLRLADGKEADIIRFLDSFRPL